jgi:hypothetical protein
MLAIAMKQKTDLSIVSFKTIEARWPLATQELSAIAC